MTYATHEETQLAEELGYTWDSNTHRGHKFQRGNRRVWATTYIEAGERKPGWQSADLIKGGYTNHQPFVTLQEALKRAD